MCAYDDHTFWPSTTKCEPSSRARRSHGREVGARVRLGEALAPDLLGREDRLQVARLLRLGAVRDDRRPGHAEPDHAEVLRRLRARRLLEEDRLVAVRLAAAAVLLRPREPDVARLVERAAPVADRVVREARRATPVPAQLRPAGSPRARRATRCGTAPRRACREGPRGDPRGSRELPYLNGGFMPPPDGLPCTCPRADRRIVLRLAHALQGGADVRARESTGRRARRPPDGWRRRSSRSSG